MDTGQLPFGGNGSDRATPTPTEQRRLLVNGVTDFNRNNPPGPGEPQTAEEQVDEALAKGVVRLHTQEALDRRHDADAAAAPAGGGPGAARPELEVFVLPHQAQIECRALKDGGIEITQEGQHGPEENATIHVGSGNVVKLARMLLWAAGFENVGFHVGVGGGYVDLDDGDTADGVYSEQSRRA